MLTKEEIDQKYMEQTKALEAEFFRVINPGKPDQHRELKPGKTIAEFNLLHGQIWRDHEAELIAGGFIEPPPTPEPHRDLEAEIDDLKVRVEKLEKK